MRQYYDFAAGKWQPEDFEYVYSPVCRTYPRCHQWPEAIGNGTCDEGDGFEYISMVTKATYPRAIRIRTTCEFASFGAPLIVISGDIQQDPSAGVLRYGLHHEFVLYEGGCNIWRIVPWPERTERPIYTIKAAYIQKPVPAGQRAELTVEVRERQIQAFLNGESCGHFTPELPEQLHVGITACEGINRFYDLTIESL